MRKKWMLIKMLVGLFPIVSILLTGCASGTKFTAAPQPQPGKALIYVYRTSGMLGAANHPNLYINGDFLAALSNGGYAVREVPAGLVVFHELYRHGLTLDAALWNTLEKEHEKLRFETEAGKTYYVRWNYNMKLEDEATGRKHISGLRLVGKD